MCDKIIIYCAYFINSLMKSDIRLYNYLYSIIMLKITILGTKVKIVVFFN